MLLRVLSLLELLSPRLFPPLELFPLCVLDDVDVFLAFRGSRAGLLPLCVLDDVDVFLGSGNGADAASSDVLEGPCHHCRGGGGTQLSFSGLLLLLLLLPLPSFEAVIGRGGGGGG